MENVEKQKLKKKYASPSISKFDLSKKEPFLAACKEESTSIFGVAIIICSMNPDCKDIGS